jgi:rhamnogalacturonyl hydrolase YesR
MRYSVVIVLILCLAASSSCFSQTSARDVLVDIVVSPQAVPAEEIAAGELSHYLGILYPDVRFEVVREKSRKADRAIYFGSVKSLPGLGRHIGDKELAGPESYVVTTARMDGQRTGIIFGSDPRGAMYGAYSLLEKLGCGFYLSYDAFPSGRRGDFSFDGWDLSDAPLAQDRIVFNWHNFLSGCSTWNLSDWKHWITQAQKMGYNGVMVHAYGNNPMVKFSFNGVDKPVGYLSTTQKGRDWSTQHVNDVRRLWGGFVFDGPVFGSEAAVVPDADRAGAAGRLMHSVFAHAEQRDMDIYFAVDVDTASANPQAVIETLPRRARFPIAVEQMRWMNQQGGTMWLANPDTPQGYRYHKAQVEALMQAYPQIDCLVVWFRHGNTPWMALKAAEMPQSWRKEYRDELQKTPEAAKLWRSHNFFALGKVVTAFERALREIGRDNVKIAVGSWRFDFLPGCDRFLPRHVKFIPLDWEVLNDRSRLRSSESRRVIREAGAHRPVLPVVWAHHDDGNYVGRPYTPYSDFQSRLVDSRAGGFGIIHWTTRPLDLYFKSLAEQVWTTTKDQPLRITCNKMAERSFGTSAGEKMGEYLYRWVTEAPKIGRDTSDRFIDRKLADTADIVPGYEQRMKLVDSVERKLMDAAGRERLDYFKGLERFITDVHRTEEAFRRSQDLYKAGNLAAARRAMVSCRPEAVIEQYAHASNLSGITRGEQGLVASMNLRWLTHYVRHRQILGTEPVRCNFAPTSHDPLAQSMGTFTFHFGPKREVWECFGTEETGAPTFVVPDNVEITRGDEVPAEYEEICRTGVETDEPITMTLQPIMAKGGRGQTNIARLPAGRYRLALLMLDPESTGPGRRLFNVTAGGRTDRIDVFGQTGQANRILVRRYAVTLEEPSRVDVTLEPVKGKALLCGAVLEPVGDNVSSRRKTISIMNRVNLYQLQHPWKESDRNWIRATYYTGVMAFYHATKDARLLEQAVGWAQRHKWQPGNERAGSNILTCGQTYLQIYFLKKDPAMIEPLIEWVNCGKPNAPSGQPVWYLEAGRRYADSLYVGPPALAMLSRTTGDEKYLKYMHAMYKDVADLLFDKEHGLFYRDKRFIDAQSRNGRKVFWSRGNGWVIAGIPRILEYLPKDDPHYAKYVNLLRTMAASIAGVQGTDGLWRTNLGDPDEYPGPETSGTAFFTYAMAWGINHGILKKDKYLPVVRKAWTGLVDSVHADGKLGWVQPVGDRPRVVESHMTHEYAVGAFLLAGSEILKLQQ